MDSIKSVCLGVNVMASLVNISHNVTIMTSVVRISMDVRIMDALKTKSHSSNFLIATSIVNHFKLTSSVVIWLENTKIVINFTTVRELWANTGPNATTVEMIANNTMDAIRTIVWRTKFLSSTLLIAIKLAKKQAMTVKNVVTYQGHIGDVIIKVTDIARAL